MDIRNFDCKSSSPGVKGQSIQEGAVVMIPNIIPSHRPTCARLGHHLVVRRDVVLCVMNVHQEDVKHQGRLGGNLRSW